MDEKVKVEACETPPAKERVPSMYHDNQLGTSKRSLKDTFRMSAVVKREFFDK